MPNYEHATGDIVQIGYADIERLIELARKDPQHKFRFCANPTADDAVHEMIIAHLSDTIVPIHKHHRKCESFTWIRGFADVQLFTDEGELFQEIHMGPYLSLAMGRKMFYRLNSDTYHTLKILSPVIVFHETTPGPWHREDMIIAPFWTAPAGWTR